MSKTDDVLGKLRALENALANTHPLACDVVNEAANLIRSLQADAQRYRWLCSDAGDGSVAWFVIERSSKKEECDAAIDAALSVGQISNIDKRKLLMGEDTGAD